jgi:hypothetical protein
LLRNPIPIALARTKSRILFAILVLRTISVASTIDWLASLNPEDTIYNYKQDMRRRISVHDDIALSDYLNITPMKPF